MEQVHAGVRDRQDVVHGLPHAEGMDGDAHRLLGDTSESLPQILKLQNGARLFRRGAAIHQQIGAKLVRLLVALLALHARRACVLRAFDALAEQRGDGVEQDILDLDSEFGHHSSESIDVVIQRRPPPEFGATVVEQNHEALRRF